MVSVSVSALVFVSALVLVLVLGWDFVTMSVSMFVPGPMSVSYTLAFRVNGMGIYGVNR